MGAAARTTEPAPRSASSPADVEARCASLRALPMGPPLTDDERAMFELAERAIQAGEPSVSSEEIHALIERMRIEQGLLAPPVVDQLPNDDE